MPSWVLGACHSRLSSVLCSLLKFPKGGLAQFSSNYRSWAHPGKRSHCVMCTHVRELYVACNVTRYVETSHLIKYWASALDHFFGCMVYFTRLLGKVFGKLHPHSRCIDVSLIFLIPEHPITLTVIILYMGLCNTVITGQYGVLQIHCGNGESSS